jgi:hypothetical protein
LSIFAESVGLEESVVAEDEALFLTIMATFINE